MEVYKINQLRNYLKEHKSITAKQAFELFGIIRIDSKIKVLRKEFNIKKEKVRNGTSYIIMED